MLSAYENTFNIKEHFDLKVLHIRISIRSHFNGYHVLPKYIMKLLFYSLVALDGACHPVE